MERAHYAYDNQFPVKGDRGEYEHHDPTVELIVNERLQEKIDRTGPRILSCQVKYMLDKTQ